MHSSFLRTTPLATNLSTDPIYTKQDCSQYMTMIKIIGRL